MIGKKIFLIFCGPLGVLNTVIVESCFGFKCKKRRSRLVMKAECFGM